MSDILPPLREVIKDLGLSAKKSLGQNFLLDMNLTAKIARASGPLQDEIIVEIGPGPGGLTRSLLEEGAKKVIVIEKDDRCLPALQQINEAYPERLHIIQGDALEQDFDALTEGQPYRIAANLPYYISTEILCQLLIRSEGKPQWKSLTFMFQKEFAVRLASKENNKDYGRLSILAQSLCSVKILFDVHPSAFTPPPSIKSSVVRLEPLANCELPCKLQSLEKLTQATFSQRRKMLRASLKPIVKNPLELLEKAGINPELRADQLPLKDYLRLAALWETWSDR